MNLIILLLAILVATPPVLFGVYLEGKAYWAQSKS
jgi:hypothetical protein